MHSCLFEDIFTKLWRRFIHMLQSIARETWIYNIHNARTHTVSWLVNGISRGKNIKHDKHTSRPMTTIHGLYSWRYCCIPEPTISLWNARIDTNENRQFLLGLQKNKISWIVLIRTIIQLINHQHGLSNYNSSWFPLGRPLLRALVTISVAPGFKFSPRFIGVSRITYLFAVIS